MSEEVEEVIGVQPITDLSEEDQKHYLWLWEKAREEDRKVDLLNAAADAAKEASYEANRKYNEAHEAYATFRRNGGGYYMAMSNLLPNGPHRLS